MEALRVKTTKLIFLSLLVSLGIALHIIESFIPFPVVVPGAKLGLANIITLLTLIIYGFKAGLTVSILRCIITSLLTGSPSSLIYSLSGAVLSLFLMALAYFYTKGIFSLVGISIIGAQAHNFAQIFAASIILKNIGLFLYLPFLMIIGLFTGYFVGLVVIMTQRILEKNLEITAIRGFYS
jgi:heptaprenyl diphosphate synthase